jgi:hypothetical protein
VVCALLLASGVLACRERPGRIELPELPAEEDGGVDASIPEGTIPCRDDADCDDGIPCTRDVCQPGRFCVNAGDQSRCSDGVFCNGHEVCDPDVGCRAASPPRCNDNDVCTLDYCDEGSKGCAHDPRDNDDDGEVDWHCLGGTDCDDFDATRSGGVAEICSDAVDNDCDDSIDELECGRPDHDRCEEALDVSAGGRFLVGLSGASPDYALGCNTMAEPDVAFTFEIDEPHDVTLIATGLLGDGSEETATIALRDSCGELRGEIECSHGFPGTVRVRALPAGRYFAVASSKLSSQLMLEARFDEPSTPPTNLSCATPFDISAGGRFEGNFVDVGDEHEVECGFPDANDLVYTFTTSEERDVELSAISTTGERMNFAVRTDCGERLTTVRCLSAAPARARLHQLPAGTYYLVLESSPSREVDFALDVAFLDPTPTPIGDSCNNPIDLTLDTPTDGTLASRQDLVNVQECGCRDDAELPRGCGLFWPDVVYRVEVDEPTDLFIDIKSGSAQVVYELRSVCDSPAAKLVCGRGKMVGRRVRNLQPGDYFLIVESAEPTNFTVVVRPMPRTTPIVVGGNDTCVAAVEVPEAGGLYVGDTLNMLNHYNALCGSGAGSNDAAFVLQLSRASEVTALLEAEFDTVLYRYLDVGEGPASCDALGSICSDDIDQSTGNKNSLLGEILDAGTYYYVVDGFGEKNSGGYLFEISTVPL